MSTTLRVEGLYEVCIHLKDYDGTQFYLLEKKASVSIDSRGPITSVS